jgi:hypothetical protein
MTAELAFPGKQDRDAVAPPFFEDGVGIDVDFLDRPSKPRRKRCQRFAHVIAQVAISPNEQRQAPRVGSEGPRLDCVSSSLTRHRCSA